MWSAPRLCLAIAAVGLSLDADRTAQALSLTAKDAVAVASPSSSRLSHERVWAISGANGTSVVEELDLAGPLGRVFVDMGKVEAGQLGYVRFVGDSKAIVNHYEVRSESAESDELAIRMKNEELPSDGYVMVEIVLASTGTLRSVESGGSHDVVVDSALLLNDSSADTDAELETSGSGSIFVTPQTPFANLTMHGMDLEVEGSGSGSVYVSVNNVVFKKDLDVDIEGSGNARLLAKKMTFGKIDVNLEGSGQGCVQAETSMKVDTIEVSVEGSGSFSLGDKGTCTSQTTSIEGSGNSYTGSIVYDVVTVDMAGSGEAYVRAKDKMTFKHDGSGTIYYVGAKPPTVDGDSSKIAAASENKKDSCGPAREAVKIEKGAMGSASSHLLGSGLILIVSVLTFMFS